MNERLPATPHPVALEPNIVSTAFHDTKLTLVPPTNGSYTMGKSTLIVAVKLSNGSPTLRELRDVNFEDMTPITAPGMMHLLAAETEAEEQSEKYCVPIDGVGQVIERDDEYYLPMVNFEFEDVEFLVPRWVFREIVGHSTLILPPETDGATVVQDDVSAADFRGLMEYMYPLGSPILSKHGWMSVAKLAARWHMVDYRNQALKRLGWFDLQPEEKIILGRLCGVPNWYRTGCIAVARGDAHLEIRHEDTIGIDAMIKIARARDAAYRNNVVSYHKRTPLLNSFTREIPSGLSDGDDTIPPTVGSNIIEDICTARANRLPGWLQSCYERLIDREESITLEETTSLGLGTTIGIWKARFQLFQEYRRITKASFPVLDFAKPIEAEFVDEFEAARLLQNFFEPTLALPEEPVEAVAPPQEEYSGPAQAVEETYKVRLAKKKKKKGT